MGNFDKKRAFGIGGGLAVLASIIAVAANISEIIQLFRGNDKPESSTPAPTRVVEEIVIEQADVIEENYAEVVEKVPPTEAQPTAVYLNDMKVSQSEGYFYDDKSSAEDTIGNTYVGNILVIDDGGKAGNNNYVVYYIGGKYKTLSGTVAVNDESSSNDCQSEISVLCDDNVVYTTGNMGRVSIPTEFSVSVENCQWLKIRQTTYDAKASFILHDFKLE